MDQWLIGTFSSRTKSESSCPGLKSCLRPRRRGERAGRVERVELVCRHWPNSIASAHTSVAEIVSELVSDDRVGVKGRVYVKSGTRNDASEMDAINPLFKLAE